MKKIITSALLLVGLSATAFAQTSGDLILGFRATGGTGSSSNLEVDLGSIGSFYTNATPGTSVVTNLLTSLPAGSTIDSVYGSSWASRSDVLWGVAGTITANNEPGPDNESDDSLFGTVVAPTSTLSGQTTTGYISQNSGSQGTASSKLTTLYSGMSDPTGSVLATSANKSWSKLGFGTPGIAFAFFPTLKFDNNLNLNGTYTAGDLYTVLPTDGDFSGSDTFLGTFAIHSNGDVTFTTVSAVPEPSTYAAILGALVLGVVLIRRRQQIAA